MLGSGGVGSAIAASLRRPGCRDGRSSIRAPPSVEALADRLREHYPPLVVTTGSSDPAGFDLIVNATPLGMKRRRSDAVRHRPHRADHVRRRGGDEVGISRRLLRAAKDKGCAVQVGTDMLFEMIPAYLEFFGFKTTTPEVLREVAQIEY